MSVFCESLKLIRSTQVLSEAKTFGAFHFFKNSAISLTCCYGFTLSSPVFPRELMTCAVVFQLCPARLHYYLSPQVGLAMRRKLRSKFFRSEALPQGGTNIVAVEQRKHMLLKKKLRHVGIITSSNVWTVQFKNLR